MTTQSGRGLGPVLGPVPGGPALALGRRVGLGVDLEALRLERSCESPFGSSNRWWDNAVLQRRKGSGADRTHDSCRHLGALLRVRRGVVGRRCRRAPPGATGMRCGHHARPVRPTPTHSTGPPVVGLTGRGPVPARRRSAYSRVVRARPTITKAASPMARLQQTDGLTEEQHELLKLVREFVDEQIIPVATELEHEDEYPTEIVEGMKEMGIFGLMIPRGVRRPRGVAAHLRAGRRGDRPRLDVASAASSTPTSSWRTCCSSTAPRSRSSATCRGWRPARCAGRSR